ncbi:MAG TPA: glycosyltransferase family 39 protein [Candidatus Acidoferrales bacterium]|nr:glycosyltransferase family 39 protein [Candidatus Acidoferrales bacterium]
MKNGRRDRTRAKRILHAATSLWLILAVALGVRLLYLWQQQRQYSPAVLATVPFAQEAGNIAQSLAAGHGFSSPFRRPTGPTAWLSPVYPLLLAGIFRVFGTFTLGAFYAAVLLNILCSAGACVPLFFAAKRLGGIPLAAGAAWLWAAFPNGVIIPFQWIWDTSLSALLAATILCATLALADSESERRLPWAAYGLLWGFALMTDAALASLMPFLFGWLLWRLRRRGQPWILRPALAAGVLVICLAPWIARNYARFHRFIPLRSNFAFELWIGNNEVLDPNGRDVMARVTGYEQTRRYAELGETAFLREKWRVAGGFIRAHPRLELWLTGRRFLGLWTGSPNPVLAFRDAQSNFVRFLYLCNVLAALAAAGGTLLLWSSGSRYAFPVSVFPVVYPCVYYATHASLRYRHPIDPILMLLAGAAILGPAARGETG